MVLESNVAAVATPPPLTEEQRMAASLENAGLAGEFEEFQYRGDGRVREQHHGGDVRVIHNHINLVPHEEGEIAEAEDEEEDMEEDNGIPQLEAEEDPSDDETYVDEQIEDIELVYDEEEEENDGGSESNNVIQEHQVQETRSGRRIRPPERFRDTIHISVGGMHFTVGHMHFTVGATDLTTPIPVHESEIKVLGVIMTQLHTERPKVAHVRRTEEGTILTHIPEGKGDR